MFNDFNKDEKKALIAILKFIIKSDGIISNNELAAMHRIAEEKGFEDFKDVFEDVDSAIKSFEDLKKQIEKVSDSEHQENMIRLALEMAAVDSNINPYEIKVLKHLSDVWEININAFI